MPLSDRGISSEEKIQKVFERRADWYDNFLTRTVGHFELKRVLRFVPGRSDVLDFGCGTGRTTLGLLKKGFTVTAFDFSPAMLEKARSRILKAGFSAEFITEEKALVGRTWPLIVCVGVLDYYREPSGLLQKICPLLQPDGTLIFTVPNARSPLAWIYSLASLRSLPVYPRSIPEMKIVLHHALLDIISYDFAFPPLSFFGLTLIFCARKIPP